MTARKGFPLILKKGRGDSAARAVTLDCTVRMHNWSVRCRWQQTGRTMSPWRAMVTQRQPACERLRGAALEAAQGDDSCRYVCMYVCYVKLRLLDMICVCVCVCVGWCVFCAVLRFFYVMSTFWKLVPPKKS